MALTKTSAWSLGTVGLCVAVTAASWFLLIDPERAEAAGTREQTVAAEQSNAQLEIQIEQLKAEFADLPTKQAELAAIRQALPEDPALASLIRAINESAADTGVRVDGLTTAAAAAVVDPAAVAAVEGAQPTGDTAEGSSDEAGAEPSAAPSTEPTDGASSEPVDAGTGVTAVEGAPVGAVLAAVPLTIETSASFYETNLLLKELQTGLPRALLVDGFTMDVVDAEDDVEPGTVRTTFNARVFVFVDPDSVEAVDAPVPSTID